MLLSLTILIYVRYILYFIFLMTQCFYYVGHCYGINTSCISVLCQQTFFHIYIVFIYIMRNNTKTSHEFRSVSRSELVIVHWYEEQQELTFISGNSVYAKTLRSCTLWKHAGPGVFTVLIKSEWKVPREAIVGRCGAAFQGLPAKLRVWAWQ